VNVTELEELAEQKALLHKFFEFCYSHDDQAMLLFHSADIH